MFKKTIVFFLFALGLSCVVGAVGKAPNQALLAKLDTLVPGVRPDSIKPTPVAGIYEVAYGTEVVYFTADGRYMFNGSLFDMNTRQDLTDQTRNGARKAALDRLDEGDMVVYAPKDAKHTITVFTDVDCPYCRRLHAEMSQYQKLGIKVRYLLFPRAGVGSSSYKKAVSVWCADDRNRAMDLAKQGKSVEEKTCENPVKEQMRLGQVIGVRGTPAILFENGQMMPGYKPAKEIGLLLDHLDQSGPQKAAAQGQSKTAAKP
jgi:thiol:disulfide interchange protein DsbC